MEREFSTLDLTPRNRTKRLGVAVAVLGLLLAGLTGYHVQRVRDLSRRLAAEVEKGRRCEQQKAAATAAQRTAQEAPAAADHAPSPPTLLPGAPAAPAPGSAPGPAPRPPRSGPPPSQEDVLALIGSGQTALQACYQKALRHNPNLGLRSLRLRLSFTVRSSGNIAHVGFHPATTRDLTGCLREAVEAWRVQPFGGTSIAVEVPITLSPQG
jgi:hypothetical protein